MAGAAHVLAEGSCSCFSVTAHNFLASSASCACTDGVAILQSARYAPDLPFSSGAVAAYTEVAAPYIARKFVKKDIHSISPDFNAVSGPIMIRARAGVFDMINEATASAHCSCETVQHSDANVESAEGTLSAI